MIALVADPEDKEGNFEINKEIFLQIRREETNSANVRIRSNQEKPNQDIQVSSKYVDNINNQIEQEHINAVDDDWLGNSWYEFNEVIFGEYKTPTL